MGAAHSDPYYPDQTACTKEVRGVFLCSSDERTGPGNVKGLGYPSATSRRLARIPWE